MKNTRIRKMVVATMLGAVGFVLMLLEFPIPIMPPFVQVDFSELPSLIGSFALGPLWGAAVCVIKNVLKAIFASKSFGVGELANILLGISLVVPAGLIYKRRKTRKGAMVGALVGSLCSGLLCLPINYYITYPFYAQFIPGGIEGILELYRVINPNVGGLWQALLMFNAPFTAAKNLCNSALCVLIYKKLSPILKGRQ